jgi:hypothetical protein
VKRWTYSYEELLLEHVRRPNPRYWTRKKGRLQVPVSLWYGQRIENTEKQWDVTHFVQTWLCLNTLT